MLKGDGIILRPMGYEDLEVYYKWSTQQIHMGDHLDAIIKNKESFMEGMKKTLAHGNMSYLIIEDNNKRSIGVVNYFATVGSSISYDVGILLAEPEARGKGIGQLALKLVVDYLFKTKVIMRIQFQTQKDNLAMKRIGEKLGFEIEGLLRNFRFDQGKARDYFMVSITREVWARK